MTIAVLFPTRRLNSVDLPTFGRPTIERLMSIELNFCIIEMGIHLVLVKPIDNQSNGKVGMVIRQIATFSLFRAYPKSYSV